MPIAKDDYAAYLDPKGREILEFLRANPDKGCTVMEVYGSIYSEEEKSAHFRSSGGVREKFQETQRWLDEFCELGYVKSKRVSTSIFYAASE